MDYKEKVIALLNSRELSNEQKEKLENIFPELKKSEDDRIREDLIQWIDDFPDSIWRGHYKKDILAWLEKQNEQKQTWKPTEAQLIVIKDLIEDKNTSKVNKVVLRGMFDEFKQFTNSQSSQFSSGHLIGADEVIRWLRDHIQVDEPQVEYNKDGQPLAESFIAHAEARCIAADEIEKQFKKDFGL